MVISELSRAVPPPAGVHSTGTPRLCPRQPALHRPRLPRLPRIAVRGALPLRPNDARPEG